MPLDFNGSSQYLTAGTGLTAHQITGDMAACCTITIDSMPASNNAEWAVFQSIGGETSDTNALWGIGIRNNSGTNYIAAFHEDGSGSNNLVVSTFTPSTATEYKIVIIRDTTAKTYQFVINGTDEGSVGYTNNPTGGSSTRLRVAASYASGSNATQWFDGRVGELGIWNATISLSDAQSYGTGTDITDLTTTNLVSHYRLTGGIFTEPDTWGSVGGLTASGTPTSPIVTTDASQSPNIGSTSRQGYATDGTYHYVSDNAALYKRNDDGTWSVNTSNTSPFTSLTGTPNHIGDIAITGGKIYAGINDFTSCATNSDHQLVVYNTSDLSYSTSIAITDHTATAAVAVDSTAGEIYMGSYCDGSKIWVHTLSTLAYSHAITLSFTITNLQGLTYKNGYLYALDTTGDLYQIDRDTGDIVWHEYRGDAFTEYEGIDYTEAELRYLAHETGSTYKIHFLTGVPTGAAAGATLTVQNMLHSHAVDSPALVQANTLAVNESVHGHLLDTPSLTQANTLAVDESGHNNAIDNIELTQANTLSVDESGHGHSIDSPTLTQANTLAVDESVHSNVIDNVNLIQANILTLADMVHNHQIDNITLNQSANLIVQELLHSHSVDNTALTQANILDLQKLIHNHLIDNIDLTQANILSPGSMSHSQALDNVTLSTAGVLAVQEMSHIFSMGNIELVQANILTVNQLDHTQTLDNIILSSGVSLIVQKLNQAQTIDNVSLTQSYFLTIQDAVHSVMFDSPALTQASTLIVSDSLHAHFLDNIDFSTGITKTPDERVFIVQRKNRTFIIARNERDFTIH